MEFSQSIMLRKDAGNTIFSTSKLQCRYILLTTKKLDCNKFIILDIEIPATESYLGNYLRVFE